MKSIVSVIRSLVIAALLASTLSFYHANAAAGFKDVQSNHWAKKEIDYLVNGGVINGYQDGSFKPNNYVTNAQVALMLVRALKLNTSASFNVELADVSPTHHAYKEISTVIGEGIFPNEKRFNPNAPISREAMARALVNAFKLQGKSSMSFSDVPSTYWAHSYIIKLAANNITTGYNDGTFKPKNKVTRAQFSAFIARALDESFKPAVINPSIGQCGLTTIAERPDSVDTGSHPVLTEEQDSGKTGMNMIATNYGDGFRIVPIHYESNTLGAYAEFEFYNATDKPQTLTAENLQFIYDRGYGDFADSHLANAPVTVQPKSKTVLRVNTSYPEATSIQIKYRGTDSFFDFNNSGPWIKDVTPLSADEIYVMDNSYVETLALHDVKGSKNFKIEPLGTVLVQNKQIGPLKKEAKGALGLVKVRIANTSNQQIKISRLIAGSMDFNTGNFHSIDYPLNALSQLGCKPLPTTIAPKTIVDGYLPFYLKDGNHVAAVYAETNVEDFQITSIETYDIIR